MKPLGLHQFTVIEASPTDLVKYAGELGCRNVCIFVHSPFLEVNAVTRAHKQDMLSLMRDLNVGIGNIEYFQIAPDKSLEDYRPYLELGGELGAHGVVAHIYDPEDQRAVATLGKFRDMANEYGLRVGLEYMGLTPACNTIHRAAYFVDQLDRKGVGIGVDMIHVARTGTTAAEIAALDPEYFAYAQICDGYGLYLSEKYKDGLDRLVPGEGDWPLQEIFTALPAATPIDVEVPSIVARKAGMSAHDRAEWAVSAARQVLETVEQYR